MAYETTNPPKMILQGITGMKIFVYDDDDPITTVDGDGYITDGQTRGMAVGDVVIHEDLSVQTTNTYRVDSITTGGAVDLADATVIGSLTDSD